MFFIPLMEPITPKKLIYYKLGLLLWIMALKIKSIHWMMFLLGCFLFYFLLISWSPINLLCFCNGGWVLNGFWYVFILKKRRLFKDLYLRVCGQENGIVLFVNVYFIFPPFSWLLINYLCFVKDYRNERRINN